MDEQFHEDPLLDRGQLRQWTERRDLPGVLRFSIQSCLLVGSGWVGWTAEGAVGWVGFGLFSALLASYFGPFHESLHRTAFRTGGLNEGVYWVSAVLQLASPLGYRDFHFAHHRNTHKLDGDPELAASPARMAEGPKNLAELLLVGSGLLLLSGRLGGLALAGLGPLAPWEKVLPYIKKEHRWRVSLESLGVIGLHIGLLYLLGWRWAATQGLAQAILSLHLLTEHTGLPTDGSVLQRTRSLRAGPIIRFFLWNMPWHAEHHAWPAVPFWRMPELHAAVAERLPERHSYGEVYRSLLQKMVAGGGRKG